MGLQVLMLLLMVLFFFCSPASFTSVSKNLIPENTDENMGDKGIGVMVNQSKHTTLATGGGGGRSTGVGSNENGDGGQSNSSPQGGGNGVVPVYAAGAAAQRRNHKGGAATYTLCWKWRFAVLLATEASLLLHILM